MQTFQTSLTVFGAILIGVGLLGLAAVLFLPRPRPAVAGWDADEEAADHLRGLRVAADDQEHGDLWGYPRALPAAPVLDERTAEVVAALPAAKAAEVVAQVAPGAGSVVSMAAEFADTKLRDSVGLVLLHEAEEAAYAEAESHEVAHYFTGLDAALARFRAATFRADAWKHYLHDQPGATCPCCTAADEISGEYRRLLAEYPTSEWSLVAA